MINFIKFSQQAFYYKWVFQPSLIFEGKCKPWRGVRVGDTLADIHWTKAGLARITAQ